MHLGAAERLVVGLLAGRHLHQRRAAEEHLGLLLDHHRVVGHARARRRRRRWSCRTPARWSAPCGRWRRVMSRNSLPPGMKISFWVGRSAPPDSTSETVGQPVLLGDLRGPEDLLDRPGVAGAALHGRVVRGDHALDALDHADAGDHAGADGEVGAPAGQRRQLEERRALVDEQLDPLAGQQLAAGVVALDVLLAAAGDRLGVLGVEVGELLQHRRWRSSWSRSLMPRRPAFIRSSVVRMPLLVGAARAAGPSTSQ